VRELALALPEAAEQDHHGRPSFRVAGRIFATLWDSAHLNVMLDDPGIRTAVQAGPDACSEVWWGKRLSAVKVRLDRVEEVRVRELLADAWEHKAPKRLLAHAAAARSRGGDPATAAEAGQELDLEIVLDSAPREVDVPAELAAALAADAGAREAFDGLAYSHRKEFARWVGEAKRAETRERRASETIRMLHERRTR
jgi:hypothetical protein